MYSYNITQDYIGPVYGRNAELIFKRVLVGKRCQCCFKRLQFLQLSLQ